MTEHHDPAQTDLDLPGVVEPPLACEICQRFTVTQWHTISEDHANQHDCAAAAGSGYWMCYWCHEAAHQHMASHSSDHAAHAAVLDLLSRFSSVIHAAPRPYRRSRSDQDAHLPNE